MRLVCISDTHMAHRGLTLPDGDVLIHSGDATSIGTSDEVRRFLDWFASRPHHHKILIAGNHDWLFQRHPEMAEQLLREYPGITYLQDSGAEIGGVKFWGSPWQPWFLDWAFNLPRKGQRIREVWNQIPMGTDVVITHGPPMGVLDQVHGGEHLGCEELAIRMATVQPRIHIFGHIHDGYGVAQSTTTAHINACSCTEAYKARNPPIVVDLTPEGVKVHGGEPNPRKHRLDAIKQLLEATDEGPTHKVVTWLKGEQLEALRAMADLRGTTTADLLRDYSKRGLISDLTKHIRAEEKPGKRPVPFVRLEKS